MGQTHEKELGMTWYAVWSTYTAQERDFKHTPWQRQNKTLSAWKKKTFCCKSKRPKKRQTGKKLAFIKTPECEISEMDVKKDWTERRHVAKWLNKIKSTAASFDFLALFNGQQKYRKLKNVHKKPFPFCRMQRCLWGNLWTEQQLLHGLQGKSGLEKSKRPNAYFEQWCTYQNYGKKT